LLEDGEFLKEAEQRDPRCLSEEFEPDFELRDESHDSTSLGCDEACGSRRATADSPGQGSWESEFGFGVEFPKTGCVPGVRGVTGPHDLLGYAYKAGSVCTQRIVVQKIDGTVTSEGLHQQWRDFGQAMLDELLTCAKRKSIRRKPRQDATNVIDTQWVSKWKHKQEAVDATKARRGHSGKTTSVIRARLTARGITDQGKGMIASYAGASSRYAQKIIISEVVTKGRDIATMGIPQAFLQGVTYAELAKLTGETQREVDF